jgi:hypothetical protein
MSWPVLTRTPLKTPQTFVANEVKHQTESNTIVRRRQFTRDRRSFTVIYDAFPEADKDLLIEHQANYGTFRSFAWTDLEGDTYQVVFSAPMKYEKVTIDNSSGSPVSWYKFEDFKFEEI